MTAVSGRGGLAANAGTRRAALAGIGRLMAVQTGAALAAHAASPSRALDRMLHALAQGEAPERIWVVDAAMRDATGTSENDKTMPGALSSAVATWFRDPAAFERPLLYRLRAPSLRAVLSAGVEVKGMARAARAAPSGRGIFLNEASVASGDRRSRVRPELPLWLAAQSEWLPYDPASAQELRALLCEALDALYVRGESGFCYLSAHDASGTDGPALSKTDAIDAFRGMYRVRAIPRTHPPYAIRLCGAGGAMANVLEAARWLQLDWGVASEIWSCPSYTRLAREAAHSAHRSLLGADARVETAHLSRCLAGSAMPVLAVTGYARHIANQIGAFVPARFAALGGDDVDVGVDDITPGETPGVRWIVLNALRLLVSDGAIPATRIAQATRRYGMA